MSIIDTDQVLTAFVKEIRNMVGSELSDLPNSGYKAVIKDIQSGIRPDYPYITVSIDQDNKEQGSWQRYKTIGIDDLIHIVSEQEINIVVTCYGDNSTTILEKLRMFSLDDVIRGDLSNNTGTTFKHFSDIQRRPEYLVTDFVNTAVMTASFTGVSDWVVPNSKTIEEVTGEGRYLHYEGDTNPILVPLDETSS